MQRLMVRKDVLEQVTSKLENLKNGENKGNSGEISAIFNADSKLQANKNVFQRGDFDDWKISDEELREHEIDKSYSKREFVNGNGKRKSYWRTRTYEGIEGQMNIFKGKNTKIIEDRKKEIKAKKNLLKIMTEDFYNFCKSHSENDVKKAYSDDNFQPILNIPYRFMNLFPYAKDSFVYCGSQTLGVHINRHNDVSLPIFQDMQKVINNTNNVYQEKQSTNLNGQKGIAFEVMDFRGERYAMVVRTDRHGRLIFWKSFHIQRNVQEKWKKINLAKLKQGFNKSVEGGQFSISQTSKASSSDLSAFPDNSIIANSKNMSSKNHPDYNGKNMLHKSFDIKVTDITENNKQKKVEQLEKSLLAIAENKPFIIKHIPSDNSKNYGDITLRIRNFDKSKIQKAVHKMAFSLDTQIKSSKGEAFNYKAQEELTDRFVTELSEKTKSVYDFVINYFGLPDIKIISKSKLKYNGKIIYDPETGKPISKREWKKFVDALQKFLNKNYDGTGEKIILSSEALGRILEKLSETNSLENIKKMGLDDLQINHRNFDWISESAANMTNVFGESVSRDVAGRIQTAMDCAAVRVTKVTDNMRNDIQDILLEGIKNKQSKSKISQNLFDKCVGLNRDFQKIADTEIQNNTNISYIKESVYNTKEGEKVYFKRFEILDDNTCKKCKALKGKIALFSEYALSSEDIDDPYADYAIWEGKEDGDAPMGTLHPYCYSDDTEVMTNNGWKLFKDVLDDDLIMAINPKTKEVDFVPFVNRVSYQYDGEMIHFPGRNFDLLVTPNHNMLCTSFKTDELYEKSANELFDNFSFKIPRAVGIWNGANPEKIRIGCVEYSFIQYVKLWAWYLSEGSGRRKGYNAYEIKLAQKDITKILNDLPEFAPRFIQGKDALYCTGKIPELFEFMFENHAATKYIPDFIKNSSVECIRAFLYSFNLGDGSKRYHIHKNNKLGIKASNEAVIRTSSKRMADDLCELIVKAGWMPSVMINKEKGKQVTFKNGTYTLNTDCYIINICKSKNKTYTHHINPGHPASKLPYKMNYSGMVYDVELEKWHFLLVKRNGKCAWSGNCRGSWVRYYPQVDKK